MKIISPSYEIIDLPDREAGVNLLRKVERYARISHRSEDKQTTDSWERFIKAVVVDHGDWSVCEHCSVTVIARVDRGVMAEWTRHRIGAYTVESTRFVNYGKQHLEFIFPTDHHNDPLMMTNSTVFRACVDAETRYLELLDQGYGPQFARSVLPLALATTMAVTYNLRSWRLLFQMRSTRETHPDMKRLVIPLMNDFKARIPILYDDLEPDLKQSISLSRPR